MTETGQIGYRTANRRVEIEVEISGHLVWTFHIDGAKPVLVETVLLRYDHGDDGYGVSAQIRGPYLYRGKPTKARADDLAGFIYERWPAWLQTLEETHRPEHYLEHRGPLNGVDSTTEEK